MIIFAEILNTMKVETTNLKKISNYAREKCVTPQAIYKWIEEKRIDCVTIDGIAFVVMNSAAEEAERLK